MKICISVDLIRKGYSPRRLEIAYTNKSKVKKPERILRGIYKEMEEERAGKGRWNRKKVLGITIPPGLARISRRKKQPLWNW